MTNTEEVELNRELIVKPGDKFTLTDEKGQEFLITGQDDPELIEFVNAVADVIQSTMTGMDMTNVSWARMVNRFNDLPKRVKNQIGGFYAGG